MTVLNVCFIIASLLICLNQYKNTNIVCITGINAYVISEFLQKKRNIGDEIVSIRENIMNFVRDLEIKIVLG